MDFVLRAVNPSILTASPVAPGQVAVNAQQYTVLVMDVPDFGKQHAKLLQRADRGQWLWRAWCAHLASLQVALCCSAVLCHTMWGPWQGKEQGCLSCAVDWFHTVSRSSEEVLAYERQALSSLY